MLAMRASRRCCAISRGGRPPHLCRPAAGRSGRPPCAPARRLLPPGGGAAARVQRRHAAGADAEWPTVQQIDDFNAFLAKEPRVCIAWGLLSRSALTLIVMSVLKLLAVSIAPHLVIAWVITRPVKIYRIPIHIALAAVISTTFPNLQRMNVAQLLGEIPASKIKQMQKREEIDAADNIAAPLHWHGSKKNSLLDRAYVAVNKYGAAYYLSRDMVGFISVGIVALLVKKGVDVGAYIAAGGWMMEEAADYAALMAVGMMVTNLCSPVMLMSINHGVPIMVMWRETLKVKMGFTYPWLWTLVLVMAPLAWWMYWLDVLKEDPEHKKERLRREAEKGYQEDGFQERLANAAPFMLITIGGLVIMARNPVS